MKKNKLLFLFLFFAKSLVAQVGINATGASAHNSAMVDISATDKGLLIPRMTTMQRTSIASPAKGLMVFDNEANSFWYYNGSAWSNLASSGGLTLPFSQTITSGSNAFDINNLGNGSAIKGNSTTANSNAIYGETSNGTGVKGYSNNAGSVAVFGSSLQGTGVKAYSLSGTALDVIGNVKISGGNTNPSAGAVLTSDATGNAVWKNSRIAFSVSGLNSNLVSLPANSTRVVHLLTEEFDYGNNYVLNTTNSPSFGNSVFVAPVAGLYHFDASVPIRTSDISSDENIRFSELRLKITRVGSPIIYADISEFTQGINTAVFLGQASISKDVHLLKNDIVELEIQNGSDFSYVINDYSDTKSHFGCHLIFAD